MQHFSLYIQNNIYITELEVIENFQVLFDFLQLEEINKQTKINKLCVYQILFIRSLLKENNLTL